MRDRAAATRAAAEAQAFGDRLMHTKDKLAAELEKAGLYDMARMARCGYYHDFLSPLDFPELQLADDLTAVGTPAAIALRNRHLAGEFDASLEESEEWANGPEGQDAMRRLIQER